MDHNQPQGPEHGYQDGNGHWIDAHHNYHSQHQSPVQEYNGFAFGPFPVEPIYSTGMHPPPRTTHQQLQPLTMPQWPSMLTSQSTYVPPVYPSAPVPVAPAGSAPMATAPTPTTTSKPSSTPRKTLTDADRRRMCVYHEEHPTTKQAEIGVMFGVERSTVSKVLRQKEKYLYQDDGSRSPIRKNKGKFPDIERALSNWARNHQRQGLPLTDAMIREKARFFATTVGSSDSHVKVNSTSWLEKFKQKYGLMGAKSRKNSLAVEENDAQSTPMSSAQTPNDDSPISPSGATSPPSQLSTTKSDENIKTDSPDSFADFSNPHQPFHSQSNTSLSSVFTDAAGSNFSGGPASPTSPFFTPDSANGPSPFLPQPSGLGTSGPPAGSSLGNSAFQRPRSQTFPVTSSVDSYISPASSEPLTPKYLPAPTLDSPVDTHSMNSIEGSHVRGNSDSTNTMQPPPLPNSTGMPSISIFTQQNQKPAYQQNTPISPSSADTTSPSSPSSDDARRALELLMAFFQNQPNGFVEPQEYVTMGKLMEKLRLQQGRSPSVEGRSTPNLSRSGSFSGIDQSHSGRLPGGLARIEER